MKILMQKIRNELRRFNIAFNKKFGFMFANGRKIDRLQAYWDKEYEKEFEKGKPF